MVVSPVTGDSIWSWKIFICCIVVYAVDGLIVGTTFPASPFTTPLTFLTFLYALITFAPLADAPLFLQWIFACCFGAYMIVTAMIVLLILKDIVWPV